VHRLAYTDVCTTWNDKEDVLAQGPRYAPKQCLTFPLRIRASCHRSSIHHTPATSRRRCGSARARIRNCRLQRLLLLLLWCLLDGLPCLLLTSSCWLAFAAAASCCAAACFATRILAAAAAAAAVAAAIAAAVAVAGWRLYWCDLNRVDNLHGHTTADAAQHHTHTSWGKHKHNTFLSLHSGSCYDAAALCQSTTTSQMQCTSPKLFPLSTTQGDCRCCCCCGKKHTHNYYANTHFDTHSDSQHILPLLPHKTPTCTVMGMLGPRDP
jgi:hypothetical protein